MSSTIVISRATVDTNVLIYAIDRAADDDKHRLASELIRTLGAGKAPLPLQCLSEFYRAVTKKRLLMPAEAQQLVFEFLGFFEILSASAADLLLAMEINQQHNISPFDALLLATALRAKCTIFFSEDFQHTRTLGSLTILNPFQLTTAELGQLLA